MMVGGGCGACQPQKSIKTQGGKKLHARVAEKRKLMWLGEEFGTIWRSRFGATVLALINSAPDSNLNILNVRNIFLSKGRVITRVLTF